MSLADNIAFFRHLPKMPGSDAWMSSDSRASGAASPLVEVTGFGSNPGQLKMFAYASEQLPKKPAMVVVLHGCTQTAAGYDVGAGWSKLAARDGFVLVMAEQQRGNNSNTCFNWFNTDDICRDSGEALSIRQMVEHAAIAHGVDPARIFVTGLSAGGAMASVMLATYPDVFAAGAIVAGLPYGVAHSMQEALAAMYRAPARSGRELGDLVRKAAPHGGPWPRVSVWHGSADRTVNPANAGEIVKQWRDLHGLPDTPSATADGDGAPREIWSNGKGETLVESITIPNMAHGTPLAIAGQSEPIGEASKFMLDAGIASTLHIAQFFGLEKPAAIRGKPREESRSRQTSRASARRRNGDVGGAISRALSAIGLKP